MSVLDRVPTFGSGGVSKQEGRLRRCRGASDARVAKWRHATSPPQLPGRACAPALSQGSSGLVISQSIPGPPVPLLVETRPDGVLVTLNAVETDNAIPVLGQLVLRPSG